MPLYVPLKRDDLERLLKVADRERRRPQDQAAVILERALDEIHADPPDGEEASHA